jgi:hypothetical protein
VLAGRLAEIHARRDAGVHSLGEIWRRRRLSCLTREELGEFLSGNMAAAQVRCVEFHLQVVGCRYCQANLADLKSERARADAGATARRKKFMDSSAGYLRHR